MTITSTCLLSSCCNHNAIDMERTFNKANIFDYENKVATIIEVKSWGDYDEEQFQIQTSDNLWIVISSFDAKSINDNNSNISDDDFACSNLGDDEEINYLNSSAKVRTK